MANPDEARAAVLMRNRAGQAASFRKYDRSLRTPMNFVLDRARNQVDQDFDVYWIDGGLPGLFGVTGLTRPIVGYNTRYIELLYFVRKALVNAAFDAALLQDMAERVCLRVMAEFALRDGSADWAVRAVLQSVIGEGVHVVDIPGTALMDMEAQPIDEAYMATWFFGLAHEVGHLRSAQPDAAQLPDNLILRALEASVAEWPHAPGSLKADVLAKAREGDSNFGLSVARLRSEAQSDMFAASVLFQAAVDIAPKVGRTFQLSDFILETYIVLNLVIMIERCQRVARMADNLHDFDAAARMDFALHPVSYAVRLRMIKFYLGQSIARTRFGAGRPTTEQVDECIQLVTDIWSHMQAAALTADAGMNKAMRFALFPNERPANLMRTFARELTRSDDKTFQIMHAEHFVELAGSFGVESESVKVLQRIIEAQSPRRDRAK